MSLLLCWKLQYDFVDYQRFQKQTKDVQYVKIKKTLLHVAYFKKKHRKAEDTHNLKRECCLAWAVI